MKATQCKDKEFSFFLAPITNNLPKKAVTLEEVFELIKSDKYKEVTQAIRKGNKEKQNEIKKSKLDYVTFSGVFSKRSNEGLKERSNLFCLDLDDVTNIKEVKEKLLEKLPPALMFVSPRGTGLKVVYRINPSQAEHLNYFAGFEKFFSDELGIKIDNGKDIARACFLCHDPEAIYQPEAPTININDLCKGTKLNPPFADLTPEAILNYVRGENRKTTNPHSPPHAEILSQLLEQIEPIDFQALAFPKVEKLREQLKKAEPGSDQAKDIQRSLEKMKLNHKNFLVLSIENVLRVAEKNNWSLCKNHDFIYLYNGAFWSEIDKETFQKFLGEAAEQMGVAMFSARFYQFREQLFKQFIATAYLPTPESNTNTVLINLQNGTFEVGPKGTKLRPFDRSDFLTYQLPFEYDPQAKAPIFEAYLNRVLPDPERQRVLAEYLGYIFVKHGSKVLKEEKALILYGTGANGKSVFFEVVNALLGKENVSSYSLQSLTDKSGYYRAMIANKLVNYASEINDKLEAALFKNLVSGEPVEARLPYGQPFILRQYAKLIFNCNELPKDVEHTHAFFRRFLIIPFDVTIPESEQDKNLHNKIIDNELSGVFNWVLEGLNRLLEQGRFSDCQAARQAVEQYKIESNSVQMFISENEYKSSPTRYKLIKELYKEYRIFCTDEGITPFKKTNFIKQLRALSFVVDRVSQNQLAVFIE